MTRPTLSNVQALRGVACLLVLGLHVAVWEAQFGLGKPLLGGLLHFAYAGVDLFFVISGFIITRAHADRLGTPAAVPDYLFRRLWRIYPPYWITLLLSVMLFAIPNGWLILPDDPGPFAKWSTWLTLTPNDLRHPYVPTAWTLPYELLFYAAFALLLVLPRRIGPWLLVAWGVLVGVAVVWPPPVQAGAFIRHLVSPYVWEFLIGCGVAWLMRIASPRFGLAVMLMGFAWAVGGVLLLGNSSAPTALGEDMLKRVMAFGPAGGMIVYGLATLELTRNWMFPRWLRVVGDASYSIYLTHLPVGTLLHGWFLGWWDHTFAPHLGWLAVMIAACVGTGLAFHWLVERPLLALGRKLPALRDWRERVRHFTSISRARFGFR